MATNEELSGTRMRTQPREWLLDELSEEYYLVAHPEHKNPLYYLLNMTRKGLFAQTDAADPVKEKMNHAISWQQILALFLMQLLRFVSRPLAFVGWMVELTANIVIANGGLIRSIFRALCSALFLFKKGPLVVPSQDSAEYLSLIGMIDPRRTLLPMDTTSPSSQTESALSGNGIARLSVFPGPEHGDRRIADVMLMAAKLAYENAAVIEEVVTKEWKMNFVGFYNCWNAYQNKSNTQVFIFTDKAQDANAIVVAWRGTEPFNAYDWSTDVDFSWYDLQFNTGKVHLGFLEALGLGDRHDMNTLARVRKNASRRKQPQSTAAPHLTRDASGLSQDVINDKILAYDDVTKVVKEFLEMNPNAKLFITGHSLGGALAMLHAGMLFYFGEHEVTDRLGAVYSIGQPRVGDEEFGEFMLQNLGLERYFRVVYCNDVVPRVPFDDPVFKFKHWGVCYYFNSLMYEAETLTEEPDRNYFSISTRTFFKIHVNAMLELLNSVFMGYMYGADYRESWASFMFRVFALVLPGIGAHSPVNYMNALRLGEPMPLVAKLYEETIKKNISSMTELIT